VRATGSPGALLVSPFNVKWRCSAQAGGVEGSKFCLFSVVLPVRCISSVSPRFYFRRHAFCFLPLAAILESSCCPPHSFPDTPLRLSAARDPFGLVRPLCPHVPSRGFGDIPPRPGIHTAGDPCNLMVMSGYSQSLCFPLCVTPWWSPAFTFFSSSGSCVFFLYPNN
jgi:hypothetical protein